MPEAFLEPTVDLAELVDPGRDVRAAAAATIRAGLAERGSVRLTNHGVDSALRDRVYAHFRAFAARPAQEKQRFVAEHLWFQRGWTTGDGPGAAEAFLAAPLPADAAGQIQHPELAGANLWPDEAFEQDVCWLGQQLHEAGLSVLSGVAMAFGLTLRTFERRLDGAPHLTRIVRSAATSDGDPSVETSLLTVHCGAREASSGDELASEDDAPVWAQVGQPLEILTGGGLVARPSALREASSPRIVCAHELHLALHEPLTPLPPLCSEEALRAYAPSVLAGTYRTKILVDRGLAPASALDRWGLRGIKGS